MNKLIIIGNGFDLAHGLKTSYKDFINNYFENVTHYGSKENNIYDDQLIRVDVSQGEHGPASKSRKEGRYYDWFKTTTRSKKIKSLLFSKILENYNSNCNWVDIENEYFKLLIESKDWLSKSEEINKDFEYIRKKLLEYLTYEQERVDIIPSDQFLDHFNEGVKSSEKISIVNFNYTNTAEKYSYVYKKLRSGNVSIINIHGQLNSGIEEPIFGIGDEHHEIYNQLKESEHLSSILKYSKSFWYMRNSNYQDLMKIVKSERARGFPEYKLIEVYGHSCGLSDRTLLKEIFEHKYITGIKLYHYPDKEGYIEQSINVWRHFDNPLNYREKLEPYDPNDKIPDLTHQ